MNFNHDIKTKDYSLHKKVHKDFNMTTLEIVKMENKTKANAWHKKMSYRNNM